METTMVVPEIVAEKEQELEGLTAKAIAQAQAFKIESDADYIEAGRRRDNLKTIDAFIADLLDGPRDAAHRLWKSLVAKRDKYTVPVEAARRIYKVTMIAWEEKKEAERQAEQRRLEAEAKAKADAEALEKAQAAEKAGDKETAAAIIEEAAQAPAPVVEAPKTLPKIAGHSARVVWSATITNPNFVKDAIAKSGAVLAKSKSKDAQEAAALLRQAFEDVQDMIYDQVRLNRLATATKGAVKRGGVTFSSRKV